MNHGLNRLSEVNEKSANERSSVTGSNDYLSEKSIKDVHNSSTLPSNSERRQSQTPPERNLDHPTKLVFLGA